MNMDYFQLAKDLLSAQQYGLELSKKVEQMIKEDYEKMKTDIETNGDNTWEHKREKLYIDMEAYEGDYPCWERNNKNQRYL